MKYYSHSVRNACDSPHCRPQPLFSEMYRKPKKENFNQCCYPQSDKGLVDGLRRTIRRLYAPETSNIMRWISPYFFHDIMRTVGGLDYQFYKLEDLFPLSQLPQPEHFRGRKPIKCSESDMNYLNGAAKSLLNIINSLKEEQMSEVCVNNSENICRTNNAVPVLQAKLCELLQEIDELKMHRATNSSYPEQSYTFCNRNVCKAERAAKTHKKNNLCRVSTLVSKEKNVDLLSTYECCENNRTNRRQHCQTSHDNNETQGFKQNEFQVSDITRNKNTLFQSPSNFYHKKIKNRWSREIPSHENVTESVDLRKPLKQVGLSCGFSTIANTHLSEAHEKNPCVENTKQKKLTRKVVENKRMPTFNDCSNSKYGRSNDSQNNVMSSKQNGRRRKRAGNDSKPRQMMPHPKHGREDNNHIRYESLDEVVELSRENGDIARRNKVIQLQRQPKLYIKRHNSQTEESNSKPSTYGPDQARLTKNRRNDGKINIYAKSSERRMSPRNLNKHKSNHPRVARRITRSIGISSSKTNNQSKKINQREVPRYASCCSGRFGVYSSESRANRYNNTQTHRRRNGNRAEIIRRNLSGFSINSSRHNNPRHLSHLGGNCSPKEEIRSFTPHMVAVERNKIQRRKYRQRNGRGYFGQTSVSKKRIRAYHSTEYSVESNEVSEIQSMSSIYSTEVPYIVVPDHCDPTSNYCIQLKGCDKVCPDKCFQCPCYPIFEPVLCYQDDKCNHSFEVIPICHRTYYSDSYDSEDHTYSGLHKIKHSSNEPQKLKYKKSAKEKEDIRKEQQFRKKNSLISNSYESLKSEPYYGRAAAGKINNRTLFRIAKSVRRDRSATKRYREHSFTQSERSIESKRKTSPRKRASRSGQKTLKYIYFKQAPTSGRRQKYVRLGKFYRESIERVVEYDVSSIDEYYPVHVPKEMHCSKTSTKGTITLDPNPQRTSKGTNTRLVTHLPPVTKETHTNTTTLVSKDTRSTSMLAVKNVEAFTKETNTPGILPKETLAKNTNTLADPYKKTMNRETNTDASMLKGAPPLRQTRTVETNTPAPKETFNKGTSAAVPPRKETNNKSTEVLQLFPKETATSDFKTQIKVVTTNTTQVITRDQGNDPIAYRNQITPTSKNLKTNFTNTENINTTSEFQEPKPTKATIATDPLYFLCQRNKDTSTDPEKNTDFKKVGVDSRKVPKSKLTTTATDPLYYLGQKEKYTSTNQITIKSVGTNTLPKTEHVSRVINPEPMKFVDDQTSCVPIKTTERGIDPVKKQVLEKGQQIDQGENKQENKSCKAPLDGKVTQTSIDNIKQNKTIEKEKPKEKQEPTLQKVPSILRVPENHRINELSKDLKSVSFDESLAEETAKYSGVSMHLMFEKCHEEIYRRRNQDYNSGLHPGHDIPIIVCEKRRSHTIKMSDQPECDVAGYQNKGKDSDVDVSLSFKAKRYPRKTLSKEVVTDSQGNPHYRNPKPKLRQQCEMGNDSRQPISTPTSPHKKEQDGNLNSNHKRVNGSGAIEESSSNVNAFWRDIADQIKNDQ